MIGVEAEQPMDSGDGNERAGRSGRYPGSAAEPAPPPFSNSPIDVGQLPDYRRVSLQRVAPAFLPHALVNSTGFWLLLALASAILPRLPVFPFQLGAWLPLAFVFAAVWFSLLAWLDARRRGWALREHDLIYRQGVIWQRTVILPFSRIQHVETLSGPLERLFGLMRVKCFTAGGMSADLSVDGLSADDARRVRQYLLAQIRDDAAERADETAVDDERG